MILTALSQHQKQRQNAKKEIYCMILCCSLNLQLFMMQQQEVQLPFSADWWYKKIFNDWKANKTRYIDTYIKSQKRKEILNLAKARRSSSNDQGEFYIHLEQLSVRILEQKHEAINKDKFSVSSENLTSMIRTIFNYKVISLTVITAILGLCIPFDFFLEVIKPESITSIYTSSIIIMVLFTCLFLLHRFYFRQRTVDRPIVSAFDNFQAPLNTEQNRLFKRLQVTDEKQFYLKVSRQLIGNQIPTDLKIVIDNFHEDQLKGYLEKEIDITDPDFRPQFFIVREYMYRLFIQKFKRRIYIEKDKDYQYTNSIRSKIEIIKNQLSNIQNEIYLIIGQDSLIFTIFCQIDLKTKNELWSQFLYFVVFCCVAYLHGKYLYKCAYDETKKGWRKGTYLVLNFAFVGAIFAGLTVALKLSLEYDIKTN